MSQDIQSQYKRIFDITEELVFAVNMKSVSEVSGGNKTKGLEIIAIDPNGREFSLGLETKSAIEAQKWVAALQDMMNANQNAQVGDSDVFNFGQESKEGDIRILTKPITVDLIKDHLSSTDKKQAQIRSEVEKYYPSTSIGNSHSDTIFEKEEFGITENPEPYVEKRVTWIDVPKDSTEESVAERLSKFPNARIYKVLSLNPILTDQQIRAME